MHIWDIAENSLKADSKRIKIKLRLDLKMDKLLIAVSDNGNGMDELTLACAADPFFTGSKGRGNGLGLALFKQAAELSGGSFEISSKGLGKGCLVKGEFMYSHIDRAPLGDMAATMAQLICLNDKVVFEYVFSVNESEMQLSSDKITALSGGLPLNKPQVIEFVSDFIKDMMSKVSDEIY